MFHRSGRSGAAAATRRGGGGRCRGRTGSAPKSSGSIAPGSWKRICLPVFGSGSLFSSFHTIGSASEQEKAPREHGDVIVTQLARASNSSGSFSLTLQSWRRAGAPGFDLLWSGQQTVKLRVSIPRQRFTCGTPEQGRRSSVHASTAKTTSHCC